jgi:hypothetical protein
LWVAADQANAQDPQFRRFSRQAIRSSPASPASWCPSPPPPGDPLDETFINLDGPSMQVQRPQPNAPPSGQLIPSPTVFSAKAQDVGQVFAITLDDAPVPNISATSAD